MEKSLLTPLERARKSANLTPRRIIAVLIDLTLLIMSTFVFRLVFDAAFSGQYRLLGVVRENIAQGDLSVEVFNLYFQPFMFDIMASFAFVGIFTSIVLFTIFPMMFTKGQTVGQNLLGIRVHDEIDNVWKMIKSEEKSVKDIFATFGSMIIKNVYMFGAIIILFLTLTYAIAPFLGTITINYMLLAVIILLPIVSMVHMLRDSKKRTLSDRILGTETQFVNSIKASDIVIEIFTFFVLILFFAPILLVMINASKSQYDIILDPLALPLDYTTFFRNIVEIVTDPTLRYLESFGYSLLITTLSLLGIGIFSAMSAWVLVRTKTWYSKLIFFLFLSGLVIPFQVVMLPLVRFLQDIKDLTGGILQLKETVHGIILIYLGFGAPLSVFLFYGFIKSVPTDIEEAAIIDGCSQRQVFFKVVLPILKPVFVTMLVLNGLWIWNDYLLPVLVLGKKNEVQTLPLSVDALAGFYEKDWSLILTQVIMAAIPLVILFFFVQKHIIKGMTSGAIK
jgi:raffinose/stachyose/melibiose transport system permease protein